MPRLTERWFSAAIKRWLVLELSKSVNISQPSFPLYIISMCKIRALRHREVKSVA